MPDIPKWFEDAINTPFQTKSILINNCEINYLTWGDPTKPGLIMVHGGMAHAHWWRYLAPFFAEHYHIVAPDFSGHGESGHRPAYNRTLWSEEAMGVADAEGMKNPVLIGHSMGGIVGASCASLFSDKLTGVIIVDALIPQPVRKETEKGASRSFRLKPYPTLEEALTRFRLMPEQQVENHFIVDFLARNSLKQTEEGWIWKFDVNLFPRTTSPAYEPMFKTISCPWVFIRGEHSEVAKPEAQAWIDAQLGGRNPFVVIPQAFHHLVIDQPLAFISTVRTILELWKH